jgi:hypothetical protein
VCVCVLCAGTGLKPSDEAANGMNSAREGEIEAWEIGGMDLVGVGERPATTTTTTTTA